MVLSISIFTALLVANAIPSMFGGRALIAYRVLSALALFAYLLFTFQGTIGKAFAKAETVGMGRRITIASPSLIQVVELAQSQGIPIAGIIKGGALQADRLQPEYLSAIEAQSLRLTSHTEGKETFYIWTINFEVSRIDSKNGVWTITQQIQRQGLHLCEVQAFAMPMHFQSKSINE